MSTNIHDIQAEILKELLFKEYSRFSEINTKKISSDQFTFHLKRLVEQGIVLKTDDGLYRLSAMGKEYANRFDTDSAKVTFEKQAKLTAVVVAMRMVGGKNEYLMQVRQKHPFFGFRGFVVGKIKIGESVIEAAARELKEEAGLEGALEQRAIYHERILSQEKELLEDKYFFMFLVHNPTGELIKEFSGGRNEWIPESQVLEGNIFYDIADLLALVRAKTFSFSEKSYTVEKY